MRVKIHKKKSTSKTPTPVKTAKLCLAWLHDHGYFAEKIFMDGVMLVLAIKQGQAYAFCTNSTASGAHDPYHVLEEMARAGAVTHCIGGVKDLESILVD